MFLVYIFSIFCIAVTAIVFYVEIIPALARKISRKLSTIRMVHDFRTDYDLQVLNASLKMAKSDRITMVWEDSKESFVEKVIGFIRSKPTTEEFRKFNYPRAFLLLGIVSYILKQNDRRILLNDFKIIFNEYVKPDGKPTFILNRVDQAPFGEIALKLFEVDGEERYMVFAQNVYNYLKQNVNSEDGIIEYRRGLPVILNDMIGLTIPFLLKYGAVAKNSDAVELAEQQMDYFRTFGTDLLSCVPAHGIEKITKAKVGSANWGRGIGWYFVGLSACANNNHRFCHDASVLEATLLKLRNNDQLWTQFPGSSKIFDASTTTMILYSIILNNPNFITKTEMLKLLRSHLSEDGVILNSSGDTYDLNEYSKSFGASELSQGFLLLLLAELNEDE